MYSDSRGTVCITSTDPTAKPALRFNYLSTETDRREWVETIRAARTILAQPAFAPFDGGELSPGPAVETDEEILDWVARDAETALHPSCTVRLGIDDSSAIDPDSFEVHGLEGVRVVDASSMRYVTNGNIYAPVMMLAEKASDAILGNTPLPPEPVEFYRHDLGGAGRAMDVRRPVPRRCGGGDATSGETFTTRNPATGEVLAEVGQASAADVDRAVASAREGFAVWSAMTGAERARVLHRAVAILRDRNDELARLEVLDTGKPIAEASTVDVASGADCIEFFASAAATLHGEYHDLGGAFAYTRREPLGVCAAIGAWNYPIQIACWKSAPALAAGNAMVFKPSELTPLTAMELAAVYTEAGLPAGRVQRRAGRRSRRRRAGRAPGRSRRSRSPARCPPARA